MMDKLDQVSFLLGYLSSVETPEACWQDWRITHVTGGWNNLLFRATNADRDLAIKFTVRDSRNRAGREFHALVALRQAGLNIAPAPILLEESRYAQPVVVQTWVDGKVSGDAPANDDEWMMLLRHYATLQRLTPENTRIELREAVVTARSVDEGKARVYQQLALLPEAQNDSIRELIHRFNATRFGEWQMPHVSLCRVDPNILNFVRRADVWLSVDWENAGWGDGAFEIADLMAHPAYASVSPAWWDWVIEQYCRLMNDVKMETRIRAYYRIMLVWWVIRTVRYLYDIPRGRDKRLVDRPVEWRSDFQAKYDHYLTLAQSEI